MPTTSRPSTPRSTARRGAAAWPSTECRKGPGRRPEDTTPRASPDKKWEALISNYNIAVRAPGTQKLTLLTFDGSEGNAYDLGSIAWSPDSTKIAAYRVKPGYRREVHYVESSPEDQLQPKHSTRRYAKPGDVLDVQQPVIVNVASKAQVVAETTLFPNAYALSRPEWRKDGRAITFKYNQRGHQVFRIIEIDGTTGKARAVVSEEPKTFFNYRTANGSQTDSGKKYRFDVADGKEIVWMSERDGWNHLYLLDGATGAVKNQITKGAWPVRGVFKVDEEKRQIWFSASGMNPGKDPYFASYYRINFDGTGLQRLTSDGDANHTAAFSSDGKYFVDTYSRVDTGAGLGVAPRERRIARRRDRARRHQRACRRRMARAGSRSRRWDATARRTSGASSSALRTSIRRRSIRSSRTSTPGRRARSCPSRSQRSTR